MHLWSGQQDSLTGSKRYPANVDVAQSSLAKDARADASHESAEIPSSDELADDKVFTATLPLLRARASDVKIDTYIVYVADFLESGVHMGRGIRL